MAIVQEVTLDNFINAFVRADRDYYSKDGYKFLYDYYSTEFDNWELDVIEVNCEWCEYNASELLGDYGYILNDYYDEEEMEDWDEDDSAEALAEKLEDRTTIVKLDNGDWILVSF